MFLEGGVPKSFVQTARGVGDAGVVFAFDDRGLCLKHFFVVIQVYKPVCLDFDNLLHVISPSKDDKVTGVVIARKTIGPGAKLGDEIVVSLGGHGFGSLEHHVLKEMGETGFSRFDLVARAGADDDIM